MSTLYPRISSLLLVLLLGSIPAAGHALHVLRGTLQVTADTLVWTVEIPSADRQHLQQQRPGLGERDWYLQRLQTGLQVLTPDGARLPLQQTTSAVPDAFRFSAPRHGNLLVLRYVPDAVDGLREQLILSVACPAQERAATLRLTSLGNPQYLIVRNNEVVRDRSVLGRCEDFEPDQPGAYQEPILRVHTGGKLELTLPLHLLHNWGMLDDVESGLLPEQAWQQQAAELQRKLLERLPGTTAPPGSLVVREAIGKQGYSMWTTRAVLRAEGEPGGQLTCRLFNPRLQQLRVITGTPSGCQVQTLGSYRPTVNLPD